MTLTLLSDPAFVAQGRGHRRCLPAFIPPSTRKGKGETKLSYPTKGEKELTVNVLGVFGFIFLFLSRESWYSSGVFFPHIWSLCKKESYFRVSLLTSCGKWWGTGWGKDWAALLSLQGKVLVVGHYWQQGWLLWEAAHHYQQSQCQMPPGWTCLWPCFKPFCGELLPVGWTHTGEVHGELSPVGKTPWCSKGKTPPWAVAGNVWWTDQNPHSTSPWAAVGKEVEHR